jgi:HK97 family phage prohead protease
MGRQGRPDPGLLVAPDVRHIGEVLEAKETDEGLEVLAQLDLDPDGSPKAKQAYRLLKGRRVTQFSFAYSVAEGAYVEKDGDSYYELRKLDLYEVGPTPVGANDQTELLGVKAAAEHAKVLAADVKAGRVLSTKNETTLRDAVASLEASAEQIKSVLAAVESDTSEANDQEKASGHTEAKPETDEGQEAKSGEDSLRLNPSVDTWATYIEITEQEGALL